MRAQGAAEFLVVVAVIIAAISVVLVPALREAEVSIALAAGRSSAYSYAVRTGLELTSIGYERIENDVFIKPVAYANGTRSSDAGIAREALQGIRKSLAPAAAIEENCVAAVFNKYCVG